MKLVQYGKGLDARYGVVQINCLEKDIGEVLSITKVTTGSQCDIIDKGFILKYEQETQQWYKQKVLTSGELLSPKTLEFSSTDWELITIDNTEDYISGVTLYKLIINHGLNTILLNGYVYNAENELMVVKLSNINVNDIKIISDEIFNGKVVLI